MKERREEMIHKVLGGIGFVLFMIGACGMDSESIVVPASMLLFGLALAFIASRNEKQHDNKIYM